MRNSVIIGDVKHTRRTIKGEKSWFTLLLYAVPVDRTKYPGPKLRELRALRGVGRPPRAPSPDIAFRQIVAGL